MFDGLKQRLYNMDIDYEKAELPLALAGMVSPMVGSFIEPISKYITFVPTIMHEAGHYIAAALVGVDGGIIIDINYKPGYLGNMVEQVTSGLISFVDFNTVYPELAGAMAAFGTNESYSHVLMPLIASAGSVVNYFSGAFLLYDGMKRIMSWEHTEPGIGKLAVTLLGGLELGFGVVSFVSAMLGSWLDFEGIANVFSETFAKNMMMGTMMIGITGGMVYGHYAGKLLGDIANRAKGYVSALYGNAKDLD